MKIDIIWIRNFFMYLTIVSTLLILDLFTVKYEILDSDHRLYFLAISQIGFVVFGGIYLLLPDSHEK